jgi:hypothetical protein
MTNTYGFEPAATAMAQILLAKPWKVKMVAFIHLRHTDRCPPFSITPQSGGIILGRI